MHASWFHFAVRSNSDSSAERLCVTHQLRGGRQLLNNPDLKCVQLGATLITWAPLAAQRVIRPFVTLVDDC